MILYVVRHGQTEYNVHDWVCGATDIPLTEKGMEQAKTVGDNIRRVHIDRVFVSPLLRARQTADIALSGTGLTYEIEPRLREENFGACEGVDRFDETFRHFKYNIAMRQPGGGESFVGLCHRIYGFIEECYEKYPEENILFICHGTLGRAIRTYFVNMTNDEIYDYAMENCELCKYELN